MRKILYVITSTSLLFTACKFDSKSQPVATVANGSDTFINFESSTIGKLPPGWSAETGVWNIVQEDTNTALKLERNNGSAFNIAVLTGSNYLDLELEARIKAIQGGEDQGGGLVWRYFDVDNYYILRANPLENNIRLYKVEGGRRKQMESKDVIVPTGKWYSIKVIMKKDNIDCFYNGAKILSASDDTFKNAGLTGFWSKADAVSLFDDLRIKILK